MADTFSNSLDDNPFASIVEDLPKPQDTNPFEAIADEQLKAEQARVQAAARWSRQYDPDAYAKAAKLAGDNLPVETVARQTKTVEDLYRLNQFSEVFQRAPALQSYFSQFPKDLAYANPDELDNLSGVNWAAQAFGQSFKQGVEQTELGLAVYEQAFGMPSFELDRRIRELQAKEPRTFGDRGGFWSGAVVGLGQSLPAMGFSLLKAGERGLQGSVGGGLIGAGVGAAAGGVGAIPGGAAGMATGGLIGSRFGFLEGQFKVQTGLAINEFAQFRDEEGKPLDPALVKWAGILAGAGSAGLEAAGASATIGQIPGMDKVLGQITVPGIKNLLMQPGIRKTLTEFALRYGSGVTVETMTEGLQEGLLIIAGELAKSADEGNFESITGQEALQRVAEATYKGFQVATLLGGLASGTRLGSDLMHMNRSKKHADELKAKLSAVEGNALIERAPDLAAKIIDSQANGQSVYIPADEFLKLYQGQGEDPYSVPLPNWRSRVTEAVQTGGDIKVSLGEFIAHFGRDPKENPLIALVRTDPNDFIPAEIQTYSAAMDELMASEVQRAEAARVVVQEEVPSMVREELKRMIQEAGYTPEAATHLSTMLGSFYETMGERTGKTPEQLFEEYGMLIQRGQDGEVDTTSPYTLAEGNTTPVRDMNDNGVSPEQAVEDEDFDQDFDPSTDYYQPAYHGTPHEFEQFDLGKIGSGEGAQAFGWGLYFAGDKKLAEFYKNKLSRIYAKWAINGAQVNDTVQDVIDTYAFQNATQEEIIQEISESLKRWEISETQKELLNETEEAKAYVAQLKETLAALASGELTAVPTKGRLFEVDLPEDSELMIWDAPMDQQPEAVRAAFAEAGITGEITPENSFMVFDTSQYITASQAYAQLASKLGQDVETVGNGWGNTGQMGNTIARQPNEQLASEFLRERGVKGHKYLKGTVRGGDLTKAAPEDFNFVIYDDQAVRVTRYEQPNRGSIRFRKGGPAVITLFETADMSTLIHESGHFFLETMKSLAKTDQAIAADFAIIAKELGITGDTINIDQHEKFARMTEAYFMQGKAPSPELAGAFAKFKSWLTFIYRQIKALGGRVSPEISAVFDRMLVTEKRLEELQSDKAYAPLFADANAYGLDPQEYLEYQKLVQDLRDSAVDKVRGRIVGQEARLQKGWMGEIQRTLSREFEDKLRKQAPYSHIVAFTSKGFKISKEAFEAKYGQEAGKKFPKTAFAKDGLDPQVAAELLGYPTADDMVYDFVQALPLKQAAKELAKAEMVKRYGEDTTNPEILDLAVKRELAEDGRVNLLAKEYRALSAKAGRTVSEAGPKAMAKEIARNSIYRKKVREINEKVTQAAARRAGAMAESLTLKGKWAEAADWKRKQMVAQALDNETQVLNRTIQKIRDKAAKYTRKAYPSIDPETMSQIRALVTRFDFAKLSGPALVQKQTLRDYMEQAQEEGFVVDVDPRFLRDAEKLNYKELTVEEILGFGDTLDNLEHIGRNRQKIQAEGRKVEFRAVKDEILQSIARRPAKAHPMRTYTQEQKTLKTYATNFLASALKPEQIIEWLDAGDIEGPMAKYIFNEIAEAQNRQNDLNLEYNAKLTEIFKGLDTDRLSELRHISGLKSNMTMEEIYAVALNMGNDSNRIKLMQGEVWDEAILDEVLSHLTKDDWDRVQQVWDVIDSLWPKISAMEKRLTGVAPPRVEARELTTRFGNYRGGYYPVVYDFGAKRGLNLLEDTTPQDKKFLNGLLSNRFIRPGTNHKYTVKRTGAKKPIKLSLAVLPSHIHTVIHDLAYREAIRGAYKILWDPEIKEAISAVESPAVHEQLQHWLKAVATEHTVESDPMINLVSHVRTGATIYAMGYRISTALAQPLGLFTSLTKVKHKHMAYAVYQMVKHPQQSLDLVNGLSGELRHRFNTQDRDIKDTMKKLANSSSPLDWVRHRAFHMVAFADKGVAVLTWLGAYRQQMSQTPGDESLAVKFADRTVRLTQGTGNVKDMAKVMNNGEIMKLFTMFYSFFSAQYNMQVDLTRKTKRDIADGNWNTVLTERLPQWMYLVALPAVFGAMLGGQGPEEDESKAAWAARTILLYPLAAVPFVRDIVGAASTGFDYKASGAFKAFEETSKALAKLMEGNLEGALKPAVVSTSIALKLPAGQAVNSVEGLFEGLAKGDLEPQDLVYGRRDK
jgi:hypothetical protein